MKETKITNHWFWFILIIVLALPPLISSINTIFKNIDNKETISITLMVPESFTVDSCLNKKNSSCLGISKSIEHIKDELKKIKNELENNISNSLRVYDKNIDVLTFSLSLYAILITVISLFFSFRESQRIDKGLEKMDGALSNINDELNERLKQINSLENKLKEFNNTLEDKIKEVNEKSRRLNTSINARLLDSRKINEFNMKKGIYQKNISDADSQVTTDSNSLEIDPYKTEKLKIDNINKNKIFFKIKS